MLCKHGNGTEGCYLCEDMEINSKGKTMKYAKKLLAAFAVFRTKMAGAAKKDGDLMLLLNGIGDLIIDYLEKKAAATGNTLDDKAVAMLRAATKVPDYPSILDEIE